MQADLLHWQLTSVNGSINAISAAAVMQCCSLVSSRVWMSGSGVRVLSDVWLAYVYVSSEFESRSQHQVCPRSLLGGAAIAIGATLRHSRLEQIQDWGHGKRTGNPGSRTTLYTLVLSVSCESGYFSLA